MAAVHLWPNAALQVRDRIDLDSDNSRQMESELLHDVMTGEGHIPRPVENIPSYARNEWRSIPRLIIVSVPLSNRARWARVESPRFFKYGALPLE